MTTSLRRIDLPMAGHVKGKRSAVTCALKCANACSSGVCNTSQNGYFRDIVQAQVSRRTALGLGLAGVVTVAAGSLGLSRAGSAAAATGGPVAAFVPSALSFTPIDPVPYTVDAFTVPEGFSWQPIIRWGDPLFTDSAEFDISNQTAAAQAGQFGYNNDYTDIVELPGTDRLRALLFVNHEYTNETIMFSESELASDLERIRAVGRAAHGLSVVELVREAVDRPWEYVRGGEHNRRFLIDTPYTMTGAAAGSDLLKTTADPSGRTVLGTLGNCAGGTTPWGTILSGEENFNGYFRSAGTSAAEKRYGLAPGATARQWELDDPRFDARTAGYENEVNRFGWIVEVDPFDPTSTPRKHTAMGRLKHEGANVIVAPNGKVVAYMGDDERFDYLYKFVSQKSYIEGDRAHNLTILEEGDLYVARFAGDSPTSEIDGTGAVPSDGSFDGTGQWIPLVVSGASAIAGMSVEEVLVNTRLAADIAGATKMDRCEDVEPNLITGKIYVACTNNSNRGNEGTEGATEVNPRLQNRDGHIVEITEDGGDQTGTTFTWNLLMLCGDYAQGDVVYFSGFPQEQVSPISCPDNLAFDSVGNLWISTDGAPDGIGYNDGLFKVSLEGADRGNVQQFLSVPREAETCGPVIRDADQHVFVSVQHPGEDGSFEAPTSYFPDYANDPSARLVGSVAQPRPAVVQVLPTVQLEPAPTPTPTPEPTPTGSPTATPTAGPTGAPSPSPSPSGGSGVGNGGGSGNGSGSGGGLAATGAETGGVIAAAAALVAAGAAAIGLRARRGSRADAGEDTPTDA
ncbi:PhoX family protein [Labedella endophytica]|uniref:PhoX family phosphatase n=1 Tax=Labedella endophytica TaxID=1523160 RepID=A0A3S0X3U8_9MICO|nr:PhoX family phosphatase [Labedella endophytica]RUQ97136.1 PhoX family phosphatase [Labedella endophytica]